MGLSRTAETGIPEARMWATCYLLLAASTDDESTGSQEWWVVGGWKTIMDEM